MLARPERILRLEGAAVLLVSVLSYFTFLHGHWGWFALLILAPDLSLLGYIAKNPTRWAAMLYNLAHNYVFPAILGLVAWKFASPLALQITAIWIAHIGMDRVLGYGLKYPEVFKPTHLQAVCAWRP